MLEKAGIIFDYVKAVDNKHAYSIPFNKDYKSTQVTTDIQKYERVDQLEDTMYMVFGKFYYALCV